MDWADGTWSTVRFELTPDGANTRLALDHWGFPDGDEDHLSTGWYQNYWDPIQAYLAK